MTGTLYVVATPIGNLEDITLRALRVLREADLVAAEDTRRTAGLLAHHAITTPTLSFHAHNTRTRLPELIDRLKQGKKVALVTDAGTPGVSDPGVELVRACVEAGIPVDPIPGASASITAAVASGFSLDPLTIRAFPPRGSSDRKSWWEAIAGTPGTTTFFEAPHRVQQTLREGAIYLADRPMMLGRELTKLHQEFIFGTAAEVCERLTEPRGEFTIVVGPAAIGVEAGPPPPDADVFQLFCHITEDDQISRRSAIRQVGERLGMSPKDVYAAVERHKSEVK